MPRPLGKLLLSKILETGDFNTCLELGLDAKSHLPDPEDREVFEFIREHYRDAATFSEVPSVELVEETFPTFQHDVPKDSVASLCVQLRKNYVQRALSMMSMEVSELAEMDPWQALELAKEQVSFIAAQNSIASEDIDLSATGEQFLEEMDVLAVSKGLLPGGFASPWQGLNDEIGGFNPGDFISIFGRPGTRKTWTAIHVAAHAYLMSNKSVLFYSREISTKLIRRRAFSALTGYVSGTDYSKFKRWGDLSPTKRDRIADFVTTMHGDEVAIQRYTGGKRKRFIACSDFRDENGGTVDSLRMKIDEYEPDIVVVDGVYLMRNMGGPKDRMSWRNTYAISQDIRILGSRYEVPIIITNQVKQEAAKTKGTTEDQAFADAFNMDAGILIRLIPVKDPKSGLMLAFPKLREGDGLLRAIIIDGVPGRGFEQIKVINDSSEVDEAEKEEEERERKKRKRDADKGKSRLGKSFRS